MEIKIKILYLAIDSVYSVIKLKRNDIVIYSVVDKLIKYRLLKIFDIIPLK